MINFVNYDLKHTYIHTINRPSLNRTPLQSSLHQHIICRINWNLNIPSPEGDHRIVHYIESEQFLRQCIVVYGSNSNNALMMMLMIKAGSIVHIAVLTSSQGPLGGRKGNKTK